MKRLVNGKVTGGSGRVRTPNFRTETPQSHPYDDQCLRRFLQTIHWFSKCTRIREVDRRWSWRTLRGKVELIWFEIKTFPYATVGTWPFLTQNFQLCNWVSRFKLLVENQIMATRICLRSDTGYRLEGTQCVFALHAKLIRLSGLLIGSVWTWFWKQNVQWRYWTMYFRNRLHCISDRAEPDYMQQSQKSSETASLVRYKSTFNQPTWKYYPMIFSYISIPRGVTTQVSTDQSFQHTPLSHLPVTDGTLPTFHTCSLQLGV